MPPLSLVTADERKSAMRHAVSYNVPCDLWVLAGSAPVRTKSRFLGLQRGAQGVEVVLEAPVSEGAIVPVRTGENLEVFFNADNDRFTYNARILGRTTFTLSGGATVRAIQTSYPTRVVRGQKRNYYRVPMSLSAPIDMRYGIIERNTPDPRDLGRINRRGKVDLHDLSGGGLSFEMHANRGITMRPGDRLDCAFVLPTNDDIRLYTRVVNARQDHGRAMVRYGTEFVDIHKSVGHKQDRDNVLRYVAGYQQQELAKRSGLHV